MLFRLKDQLHSPVFRIELVASAATLLSYTVQCKPTTYSPSYTDILKDFGIELDALALAFKPHHDIQSRPTISASGRALVMAPFFSYRTRGHLGSHGVVATRHSSWNSRPSKSNKRVTCAIFYDIQKTQERDRRQDCTPCQR
ncbi:hypothetical protein AG1IA_05506 [Rhizoctonia solani AG-1 IA]|uniref:Uncharacterized protein n=1 Tax=Thanatephorus cucumeris (strain AG1-IA) TaxID=983506 RepID=L8WUJ7_THACA|nr:hypothetical protein AG1IA_05506 [Rhizoctonia solani AG-1 IA]